MVKTKISVFLMFLHRSISVGARFCDGRVYAGFNKVYSGMKPYEEYVLGNVKHDGENNFPSNRIPLWI